MFVDYSGLQRFSIINESFAHKYLQMLHYETIRSPEERLQQLKDHAGTVDTLESIQLVRLEDFKMDWGIIDYLFKMLLCISQMQEVAPFIKRCPTVYIVEIFDRTCSMSRYSTENLSYSLAQVCQELQDIYDSFRRQLFEEVKKTIVELKPDYEFTNFQNWHILQKCLYYECCDDLPSFMIPKTDVIVIPKTFPRLFAEQVNSDGFMKVNSQVRFLKFETTVTGPSFEPLKADDLVLTTMQNKVTTIWKGGNEKKTGGTILSRTKKPEVLESLTALKKTKESNLLNLFQERDVNIEANRPINAGKNYSRKPSTKHRESLKNPKEYAKETSFNQEDPISTGNSEQHYSPVGNSDQNSLSVKSSFNDVFSPLRPNNLPTAMTPENCSTALMEKKMHYYFPERLHSSSSIFLLPPPTPLSSPVKAYEVPFSKRKSVKLKFKKLMSNPIQKYFSHDTTAMRFEVFDSSAEFDSLAWNDLSTKKFIRYKLKKWKRDYHYYTRVAKNFFEDLHESNVSLYS